MDRFTIFVVTGASGAGKTTLVKALEARGLPGVSCYYFDLVGVPSFDEMIAQFGSTTAAWQAAMAQSWIERLKENPDDARIAVLDGQVRISMMRDLFATLQVSAGRIVLIDCDHDTREARLRTVRQQPELANRDMLAWAAYLRGQADALAIPIIDTTHASVSECADALADLATGVA